MSTPNPLVPQGSLLEQQARSRSTFQMAAFIVALHVVVLGGFLFLGCKKEENQTPSPTADTFSSPSPINTDPAIPVGTDPLAGSTNAAFTSTVPPVSNGSLGTNEATIPAPFVPPAVVPQTGPVGGAPEAGGTEYVVKKGDTGAAIAKKHGVTLKQLQEANPGKDLAKLKITEKIVVPASAAAPAPASATAAAAPKSAGTTYRVKGGDNLSKLAKKFGTTVKAIREANGLKSNEIKVGQSLVIPGKSGSAAVPEAAPVPATTTPTPVLPAAPPIVTPVNPVGSPTGAQ